MLNERVYNSLVLCNLDELIGSQKDYTVTKLKLTDSEVFSLTGFYWNAILKSNKRLYYMGIRIIPRRC